MIHVLDYQTEKIVATLENKQETALFWEDWHKQSLQNNQETFDFTMQANVPEAEYVSKRNRVIIPDEDGFFREFIIYESYQYDRRKEVYTNASFTELAKQKILDPVVLEGQTVNNVTEYILADTEWQLGTTEYAGIHKVTFDDYTDVLSAMQSIASLFELELRFRVEIKGNQIVGRFVDLITKVGVNRGKEIVLGKDLIGVKRRENSDIVTALIGLGLEKEDGTRLVVRVEDQDALERWGKNGKHLWGVYTPESSDLEMTVDRLTQLTQTELNKRINTSVQYEADAASIEHIFGFEHEKVRLGDTVRIKDTSYKPPLYLEARIINVERMVSDESQKKFVLGDFIEYSEEDVMKAYKALKALMEQKIAHDEIKSWNISNTQVKSESTDLLTVADTLNISNEKMSYVLAVNSLDTTVSDWVGKTTYQITDPDRDDIKAKFQNVQDLKSKLINKITDLQSAPGKEAHDWINGIRIVDGAMEAFYGEYATSGRKLFDLFSTIPLLYDGNKTFGSVNPEAYGKLYGKQENIPIPAGNYDENSVITTTISIADYIEVGLADVVSIQLTTQSPLFKANEKRYSRVTDGVDLMSFDVELTPNKVFTDSVGFSIDLNVMVLGMR